MKNSKKTFWPYGILLSIFLVAIGCVLTVLVAIKNPVQMDNFYLEKYQKVDRNFNEIQLNQEKFLKKYEVNLLKNTFNINEDINLKIQIIKMIKTSSNLSFDALITRQDSDKFDIKPEIFYENGVITIKKFKVKKRGMWQFLLKIKDNDSVGFFKFDFLVK